MSLTELTRAVLGAEYSMSALLEMAAGDTDRTGDVNIDATAPPNGGSHEALSIGSIGYERFPLVADFAQHLRQRGIERLIDVRQLPMSRRRGFAKTALSLALASEGVEYVHMKGLGNPKPIRDLYKSGRPKEGRVLYEEHLEEHGADAIDELLGHVRDTRCALMCVEHDAEVCHRHVIFDAVRARLDAPLEVTDLG